MNRFLTGQITLYLISLSVFFCNVVLGQSLECFYAVESDFSVSDVRIMTKAKFNEDEYNDLAVVQGNDSIQILYGSKSGQFTKGEAFKVVLDSERIIKEIKAEDLSGDGLMDIVVLHRDLSNKSCYISTYLKDEKGFFLNTQSIFNLGGDVHTVALGQFSEKETLDLAVFYQDRVMVHPHAGYGAFSPDALLTYLPSAPDSERLMSTGDFNNDGITDIAYVGWSKVFLLLANKDYSFEVKALTAIAEPTHSLINTDYDGDGFLDLVLSYTTVQGDPNSIRIFPNTKDGSFNVKSEIYHTSESTFYFMTSGDFNDDKYGDIIVSGKDGLHVFNGNLKRELKVSAVIKQNAPYFLMEDNLTGEGKSGIVFLNNSIRPTKGIFNLGLLSVTDKLGDYTLCKSDPLFLEARVNQLNVTYNWFLNEQELNYTNPSINLDTVSPSTSGTYEVQIANRCGESVRDISVVEIIKAPQVWSFTTDNLPCESENLIFTIKSTGIVDEYSLWADGGEIWHSTTENQFLVESAALGTYTARVENTCGFDTSQNIYVNSKPSVIIRSERESICYGDDIELIGDGADTLQWVGFNSSESVLTDNPESTFNYILVGTNSSGCKDTAQKTIVVNPLPEIYIGPVEVTTCIGQEVTFEALGDPGVTFEWPGSSNHGSSISVTPKVDTTIMLRGIDANNCVSETYSTIYVDDTLEITIDANNSIVCEGEPVVLTALNAENIQWDNGVDDGSLFFPTETKTYKVEGTKDGCFAKGEITIEVNPKPVVLITSDKESPICLGGEITLTASGAETYEWIMSSYVTIPVFIDSPTTQTKYSVKGIDSNGCIDTASIVIDVFEPTPIEIEVSNNTVCEGEPVVLTALNADNVQWDNGITDGVPFFPNETKLYNVVGIQNGCFTRGEASVEVNPKPVTSITSDKESSICLGTEITLTASDAETYEWIGSNVTIPVFIDSPTTQTEYSVKGIDSNGCIDTAFIVIDVFEPSPIEIEVSSNTICEGESVVLTALNAEDIQWDNGITDGVPFFPNETKLYNVVGIQNGCFTRGEASVEVNPKPVVLITSDKESPICRGAEITLTASDAETYEWIGMDVTTPVFIDSPTTQTEYSVKGIDSNGCIDTASIVIDVFEPSPIEIEVSSNTICEGESVVLTALNAEDIQWDNGIEDGVPFFPKENKSYHVSGTQNGCFTEGYIFIAVDSKPSVVLKETEVIICAGEEYSIEAEDGLLYEWSGFPETGPVLTVNPSEKTVYTVIGINDAGCRDTSEAIVVVNPLPDIRVHASAKSICKGEQVVLIASGGEQYEWEGFDVVQGVLYDSPPSTFNYKVYGIDENNCAGEAELTVTVNTLPEILISPSEKTICEGEEVILEATGGETYIWDGLFETNSVVSDSPTRETVYKVTGKSSEGCSADAEAIVRVVEKTIIQIESDRTEICAGDAVVLTALDAENVQWDNGISDGEEFFPNETSIYKVQGEINGCPADGEITIKVNPVPSLTIESSKSEICAGESVVLSGTANIGNAHWNNNVRNGEAFRPSETTTYTFTSSLNGCENSEEITITVKEKPSVQISSTARNVCLEESVTLTASGADEYIWNHNVFNGIAFIPMETSTYRVIGTSNTCSDTAEITITVFSQEDEYCKGIEEPDNFIIEVLGDLTAGEIVTVRITAFLNNEPYRSYSGTLDKLNISLANSLNPAVVFVNGVAEVSGQITESGTGDVSFEYKERSFTSGIVEVAHAEFARVAITHTDNSPLGEFYTNLQFPIKLVAVDSYNNVVKSFNGEIELISDFLTNGSKTVKFNNGVLSEHFLLFNKSGQHPVTVRGESLSPSTVNFQIVDPVFYVTGAEDVRSGRSYMISINRDSELQKYPGITYKYVSPSSPSILLTGQEINTQYKREDFKFIFFAGNNINEELSIGLDFEIRQDDRLIQRLKHPITIISNTPNISQPECIAEGECAGSYISEFRLDQFEVSYETCSGTKYTDHTARKFLNSTFSLGNRYNFSLKFSGAPTEEPRSFIIWADLNDNSSFGDKADESNETMVFSSFTGDVFNGSILIPDNEEYAGPKRLRVALLQGIEAPLESCHMTSVLDMKDYLIELESPLSLQACGIITPNGDGLNDYFEIRGIKQEFENQLQIFDRMGKVIFAKDNYKNDWEGSINGEKVNMGTYFYIFSNGPEVIKGYFEVVY